MTKEARHALIDEIAELRKDVAILAGAAPSDDGIVRLPAAQAARRLETLEEVLAGAELIDDGRAVIGRRVELRDEDGESMSYTIVFPGDGDPSRGWVSADSPLGSVVLGARPGKSVHVSAPVGRWRVTVVDVA
jgi:transcription elongation GreA/GreB family factor